MNQALELLPADYHSKFKINRDDIFDKDSWLSKSALWELRSSSLWKWKNHPKQYTTKAMQWGSLVDCLLTCPIEFPDTFVVQPPTYKGPATARKGAEIIDKPWNANAKVCKAWIAEQGDKAILSQETLDEAHKAVKIIMTHRAASWIIDNSETQVFLHGKYKDLNLKCLVDFAPPSVFLADLKTTADFSVKGFESTILKYGYHVQAGFYLMVWNQMHPNDKRERFQIVWQNSAAPYEVACTEIPHADIVRGQDLALKLIKQLITAYKTDSFPMLCGDGVQMVSCPVYGSMAEDEEIDGVIMNEEAPSISN